MTKRAESVFPDAVQPESEARIAASDSRRRQRAFRHAARELLQPSPVRRGVPNWFRLALLKHYWRQGNLRYGWAIVDDTRRRLDWTWLDHTGQTDWGGRLAFCSEPYSLDSKEIQQIAELAETIGCEYHISPNSWWYPGDTIRILLYERKDEVSR